jgi:uncharacterized integral membrane protein
MMTLLKLIWRIGFNVIRVFLIILLFLIAITNTSVVEFHWFIDQSIQIPLNVLLLGAFLLGLVICAIVLLLTRRKV